MRLFSVANSMGLKQHCGYTLQLCKTAERPFSRKRWDGPLL